VPSGMYQGQGISHITYPKGHGVFAKKKTRPQNAERRPPPRPPALCPGSGSWIFYYLQLVPSRKSVLSP
jgi:hypothetical protein